jgi:lysophospholipase L1-like esterase
VHSLTRDKLRFRLAVTLAVLAVFPLVEMGLRLADYEYAAPDEPLGIWNPREDRAMRFGSGMFTTAPRQLWVPRPGARVVWGADERINEAGYRGDLRPAGDHPGVLRVLVLGESCTFGYGVPNAETFSSGLEAILRQHGREVEVLNAGVIGYTVRQGLERYRAMGRSYRPDFVVAAFGEVNEHFDAGGPSDARKIELPLETRSTWSDAVGFVRANVRIAHLLASLADGMSEERRIERDLEFRRLSYEHAQRQHMGEVDWKGQRRVPLADFEAATLALANEVRDDAARFVALSLPRRQEAEEGAPVLLLYTRSLEALAARENLAIADAYRAFRDAGTQGVPESDLFRDAWHLSTRGHALVASTLAQRIESILDPR